MQRPSWKIRRRIIHLTLLFCGLCVVGIALKSGTGRGVDEVIVMCAFGLAFAVIGSYVFGAVWDDKNFMDAVSGRRKSQGSDYSPEDVYRTDDI